MQGEGGRWESRSESFERGTALRGVHWVFLYQREGVESRVARARTVLGLGEVDVVMGQ